MLFLDGEHTWRDLHNRLINDVKADFFRFNVTFKGAEPEIDDVSYMDNLVDSVSEKLATSARLTNIAIALLVSYLYFKFDRAPEYDDGFLRYTGSIRCGTDCTAFTRALRRLVHLPLTLLMLPDVRKSLDLAQSICP